MGLANKPQLALSIETILLDGRHLLIQPETGAWAILDRNALDLALSLRGTLSVAQIIHRCGNNYSHQDILYLVDALSKQGLLDGEVANTPLAPEKPMPNLAVLHFTESCNLACPYCYVSAGRSRKHMSLETTLRIIHQMLNLHRRSKKSISILFHGGEPLLNFNTLRQAIDDLSLKDVAIQYEIQTNATLLSDEHVSFFKDHQFKVGISLDGPQPIHDSTRRFLNGKGSFDRVVKGIEMLKEGGVDFGVIVVLNSKNWMHMDVIFETLIGLGVHSFSLNPIFFGGRAQNSLELGLNATQLFQAYATLAQKLAMHNRQVMDPEQQIEERTLKYLIRNVTLRDRRFMCMRTPCGAGLSTLGFDTNGDVYLCDDFVQQPGFCLGNVYQLPLLKMLGKSQLVHRFRSRSVDSLPRCSNCIWRNLCNGLCPSHIHYAEQAGFDNAECEFRRNFIPYLIGKLSRGELSPNLLDREIQADHSRHFYFNINYACNNRCIFCASDSTNVDASRSSHIDAATLSALLKLNRVSPGDWVIVNGGEPTVSRDVLDILRCIAKFGAYSHLFTNGRRLSKPDYCYRLLGTGVNRISIPIYGTCAEEQDSLTHVPGSFLETVAGISNVVQLRRELFSRVTLELKMLFFKPTLDRNPKILAWIADRYPSVDIISLNALIVSDNVARSWGELVAEPDDLKKSVNATLRLAQDMNLESVVRINDLPYCLVEAENSGFLPSAEPKMSKRLDYYFDPTGIGGQSTSDDRNLPNQCRECVYTKECRFANRAYLNDSNAQRSFSAFFKTDPLIASRP